MSFEPEKVERYIPLECCGLSPTPSHPGGVEASGDSLVVLAEDYNQLLELYRALKTPHPEAAQHPQSLASQLGGAIANAPDYPQRPANHRP